MTERVLGFRKKDALQGGTVNDLKEGTCRFYKISKEKLVPVVSFERLKKRAKLLIEQSNVSDCADVIKIAYEEAINDLLSAAKKEAGRR